MKCEMDCRWECQKSKNLLPKLFSPIVRKNCSSDQEILLKFEAKGQEFSNNLRSLEQFYETMIFWLFPGGFSDLIN